MEPGPIAYAVMVLGFVLVSLAAGAEYVLADLNRGRIRQLVEAGDTSARRLEGLVSGPPNFITAFLLVKNLGTILAAIALVSLRGLFPGILAFFLVLQPYLAIGA